MKTFSEELTRHRNGHSKGLKDAQLFEGGGAFKTDSIYLISVVVPTLMEEKILEETLSIYTNEFKKKHNLELIVSDGGSTDGTIEIAKKYADKVVIHDGKSRQTISDGRNMGAEAAAGDTIVFINADTIPEDVDFFFEFINRWHNGKTNYKNAEALACTVNPLETNLRIKDKLFYAFYNRYVHFLNIVGLGMGRGECQIVRKKTFNRVGGYNEKYAAGEDFDLYRRIGKIAKIGFVKQLVVKESIRRFKRYGYFKTVLFWTMNSIYVMIFGKSYSKQWEAIR